MWNIGHGFHITSSPVRRSAFATAPAQTRTIDSWEMIAPRGSAVVPDVYRIIAGPATLTPWRRWCTASRLTSEPSASNSASVSTPSRSRFPSTTMWGGSPSIESVSRSR